MQILQYTLTLPQKRRGFHLITPEVVRAAPGITQIRKGVCQVFIQHTSASLTINENADPTVRRDFETFFNKALPQGDADYFRNNHGPALLPPHLKHAIPRIP